MARGQGSQALAQLMSIIESNRAHELAGAQAGVRTLEAKGRLKLMELESKAKSAEIKTKTARGKLDVKIAEQGIKSKELESKIKLRNYHNGVRKEMLEQEMARAAFAQNTAKLQGDEIMHLNDAINQEMANTEHYSNAQYQAESSKVTSHGNSVTYLMSEDQSRTIDPGLNKLFTKIAKETGELLSTVVSNYVDDLESSIHSGVPYKEAAQKALTNKLYEYAEIRAAGANKEEKAMLLKEIKLARSGGLIGSDKDRAKVRSDNNVAILSRLNWGEDGSSFAFSTSTNLSAEDRNQGAINSVEWTANLYSNISTQRGSMFGKSILAYSKADKIVKGMQKNINDSNTLQSALKANRTAALSGQKVSLAESLEYLKNSKRLLVDVDLDNVGTVTKNKENAVVRSFNNSDVRISGDNKKVDDKENPAFAKFFNENAEAIAKNIIEGNTPLAGMNGTDLKNSRDLDAVLNVDAERGGYHTAWKDYRDIITDHMFSMVDSDPDSTMTQEQLFSLAGSIVKSKDMSEEDGDAVLGIMMQESGNGVYTGQGLTPVNGGREKSWGVFQQHWPSLIDTGRSLIDYGNILRGDHVLAINAGIDYYNKMRAIEIDGQQVSSQDAIAMYNGGPRANAISNSGYVGRVNAKIDSVEFGEISGYFDSGYDGGTAHMQDEVHVPTALPAPVGRVNKDGTPQRLAAPAARTSTNPLQLNLPSVKTPKRKTKGTGSYTGQQMLDLMDNKTTNDAPFQRWLKGPGGQKAGEAIKTFNEGDPLAVRAVDALWDKMENKEGTPFQRDLYKWKRGR